MTMGDGGFTRRREIAGFMHLDLQSADVPTHEAVHFHLTCVNGKCWLDLRRKQDTYSLTLTSGDDGPLALVMNQIVGVAFSSPR